MVIFFMTVKEAPGEGQNKYFLKRRTHLEGVFLLIGEDGKRN